MRLPRGAERTAMTTADKRTAPANRESTATAGVAPNGAARRTRTRESLADGAREASGAGETPAPLVETYEPAADVREDSSLTLPTIRDVWRAQEVIRPHVTHTPILPSRTLSAMTGATVSLKAE